MFYDLFVQPAEYVPLELLEKFKIPINLIIYRGNDNIDNIDEKEY